MNSLKKFETNRLHHGKYQYKLVLSNQLSKIFRASLQQNTALGYARKVLDQLTECYSRDEPLTETVLRTTRPVSIKDYLDAKQIYAALKFAEDYRVRIGPGHSMMIYTNDKSLLEKISKKMKVSNREFWEPDPALEVLLRSEKNIILTNTVPEFPLKITLGSRKVNPDFVNWLEANTDKSRIGATSLNSIRRGYYTAGLYFYIRDEKVLSLVTMLIGNNIRRIDKLLYKKNIDKY